MRGTSSASDAEKSDAGRRAFPRVEINLEARLVGENGESGKAELLNLSRGGAALRTNVKNGLRVFPQGQIRPGTSIGLRFNLGSAGQESAVFRATGRVVWSQRVGDDQFVMGLEFTTFHGDSAKLVEDYLVECMRID